MISTTGQIPTAPHLWVVSAACAATFAMLASPAPVWADTASGDTAAADDRLQEIVVTATRREENAQDVGIAIKAFSGEDLAAQGVTKTSDLVLVTPGLIFTQAGGSEFAGLLSIRGVSQNDFTGQIESPNAFYIDDFYQASASASVQQMFDVSRVEVLKGPQGTLFGRNATGGLMNVITNSPQSSFGGYATASVGNYDDYKIQAAVTGPLSDTTQARIAVLRHEHGPYYKNIAGGPDLNRDNTTAGRVKLDVTPSDALTIKLGADWYHVQYEASGGSYELPAAVDPVTGLGHTLPRNTPFQFSGFVQTGKPFETQANFPGRYYRDAGGASANVSYDLGSVTLSSLTNYSLVRSDYQEDNDQTQFDIGNFDQRSDSKHFTQEIRLYNDEGSTRWQTGLYYLYIDGEYSNRFNFIVADADLNADYAIKTDSYSVFGQLAHDLTDRLTLTVGARVVRDERDYLYVFECLQATQASACPGFGAPGTIGGASPLRNKHGETGYAGRLQLDFKVDPDTLLYASINRGYKGFNYNANFAGNAPLSQMIIKGEDLMAYELGGKFTFWDDRARFNTAAYYYDYTNYQAYDSRGLNFTIFNSDAKIYGAEGDLRLSPGAGITLGAGLSYVHSRVSDVPLQNGLSTRHSPQSPSFTVTANVAKRFDLPVGALTAQMDGVHFASQYAALSNAPNTFIKPYELVNARLSLALAQSDVQVSLYGRNIFFNKKPNYAFDLAVAGYTEWNFAEPRTYGVELNVNF